LDLILLSGGHDSSNLIEQSIKRGKKCVALFFDYGQQAFERELIAAVNVTDRFGVRMIRRSIPNLQQRGIEWVGRNLAFISAAVLVAAEQKCDRIVIGCTSSDHAQFPDCRVEFLSNLNTAVKSAYGVEVVAPLRHRPKTKIHGTWSCYENGPVQCGKCVSCLQN